MRDSPGGTQIGGDVSINVDQRRALTQSTAESLIHNLRQTVQRDIIITTNLGDLEAQRFAQQLSAAFVAAGWREPNRGEAGMAGQPLLGISIRSRNPVPPDFTQALEPLFEQFGQAPSVAMDPSATPDRIEVFVGVR